MELLLKLVPLKEMPESLMFRGAQGGQRREGGVVRCVWGDCVLSGLYDSRSQGDEEQVGESALGSAQQHSGHTGLATPFLFSFFLLLLVCDSLFDVTRKAVGNMGYFPVTEDVCVADVSSVSGAALGLYNIVNCATPRDLESPQPHAPAPR